jgi:ABC-type amino acid transport substrate-binding protein
MDGEEYSISFRRKILQRIKDLTNNGKHIEAQQLYTKYFGGPNGKN